MTACHEDVIEPQAPEYNKPYTCVHKLWVTPCYSI